MYTIKPDAGLEASLDDAFARLDSNGNAKLLFDSGTLTIVLIDGSHLEEVLLRNAVSTVHFYHNKKGVNGVATVDKGDRFRSWYMIGFENGSLYVESVGRYSVKVKYCPSTMHCPDVRSLTNLTLSR